MPADMQTVVLAGWALSALAFVATIIAVIIINSRRKKGDSAVSAWLGYTIGIFVTAFFLLLSQEIVGLAGSEGSPILLDTVLGCMQMLSTGRDISLDMEALSWMGPALPAYVAYNASLFVAAPVGTLGTIFAFAASLFGMPAVRRLAQTRNVYVMSELNKPSFELGRSIAKLPNSEDENLVIYANVDDPKASLASSARMFGARCLSQAPDYIAAKIGSSTARERIFVITGEDEVKNLGEGIELARSLKVDHEAGSLPPQVLIFSNAPVAGFALDAAAAEINDGDGGPVVRVRRVDWVRSAIDKLLDTYPLFATGLREDCMAEGRFRPVLEFDYAATTRRILVVGQGAFAEEFLKGALWASQLGDEIQTQIDIIADGLGDFESRFALECPEFVADDGRPYQGHYHLRFVSADPEGAGLAKLLEEDSPFGEYTHVFVALDDDLATAKVARRIRELLEKRRLKKRSSQPFNPAFIAAIINNAELAGMVRNMSARKRSYAILPIGDDAEVYGYDNIFNPALYRQAQNVNRIYNAYALGGKSGAEFQQAMREVDLDLTNSEYNLRSSLAAALHRKYALFLVCRRTQSAAGAVVDWTQPLEQIDRSILQEFERYIATEDSRWLSQVEHDRWSAYVGTEGHEYASFEDVPAIWEVAGRQNYELAHLHPCLIEFDDLPKLDTVVEPLKGSNPTYQKLDDDIVQGISMIAASDKDFEAEWHRHFER